MSAMGLVKMMLVSCFLTAVWFPAYLEALKLCAQISSECEDKKKPAVVSFSSNQKATKPMKSVTTVYNVTTHSSGDGKTIAGYALNDTESASNSAVSQFILKTESVSKDSKFKETTSHKSEFATTRSLAPLTTKMNVSKSPETTTSSNKTDKEESYLLNDRVSTLGASLLLLDSSTSSEPFRLTPSTLSTSEHQNPITSTFLPEFNESTEYTDKSLSTKSDANIVPLQTSSHAPIAFTSFGIFAETRSPTSKVFRSIMSSSTTQSFLLTSPTRWKTVKPCKNVHPSRRTDRHHSTEKTVPSFTHERKRLLVTKPSEIAKSSQSVLGSSPRSSAVNAGSTAVTVEPMQDNTSPSILIEISSHSNFERKNLATDRHHSKNKFFPAFTHKSKIQPVIGRCATAKPGKSDPGPSPRNRAATAGMTAETVAPIAKTGLSLSNNTNQPVLITVSTHSDFEYLNSAMDKQLSTDKFVSSITHKSTKPVTKPATTKNIKQFTHSSYVNSDIKYTVTSSDDRQNSVAMTTENVYDSLSTEDFDVAKIIEIEEHGGELETEEASGDGEVSNHNYAAISTDLQPSPKVAYQVSRTWPKICQSQKVSCTSTDNGNGHPQPRLFSQPNHHHYNRPELQNNRPLEYPSNPPIDSDAQHENANSPVNPPTKDRSSTAIQNDFQPFLHNVPSHSPIQPLPMHSNNNYKNHQSPSSSDHLPPYHLAKILSDYPQANTNMYRYPLQPKLHPAYGAHYLQFAPRVLLRYPENQHRHQPLYSGTHHHQPSGPAASLQNFFLRQTPDSNYVLTRHKSPHSHYNLPTLMSSHYPDVVAESFFQNQNPLMPKSFLEMIKDASKYEDDLGGLLKATDFLDTVAVFDQY